MPATEEQLYLLRLKVLELEAEIVRLEGLENETPLVDSRYYCAEHGPTPSYRMVCYECSAQATRVHHPEQ